MLRRLAVVLISGVFVFGISKLSFAMECADHDNHQQMAQAGSDEQAAGVSEKTAQNEAVSVGNKICPVTGEKIDEKIKVTYEYQGKIYNFCCAGCPEEFKKDPKEYIKKIEEEKQKVEQPYLSGETKDGIRLITIVASRYKFMPDTIKVRLGEQVRLIVTSIDATHGLNLSEFKVNMVIEPGKTETAEFIADKEGTFSFFCKVYCGEGHSNMRGKFIVIKE